MSINWWMDKLTVVYPHSKTLLSNKNIFLKRTTSMHNMDESKSIMLSERSRILKATYLMIPFKWHIEKGKLQRQKKYQWLLGIEVDMS